MVISQLVTNQTFFTSLYNSLVILQLPPQAEEKSTEFISKKKNIISSFFNIKLETKKENI